MFFYIREHNEAARFYYIQFRFFELAIGGLCAILFNSGNRETKNHYLISGLLYFSILSLFTIIFTDIIILNQVKVILVTIFTGIILVSGNILNEKNRVYQFLFSNKPVVLIGKISFSLYMWHQIVLAFTRYYIVDEISPLTSAYLFVIVFVLSLLSWHFIENPFRDRKKMKTKYVLITVVSVFLLLTTSSLYVYLIGGVIRDYPELELTTRRIDKISLFNRNSIHIQYNEKIREYDKNFTITDKPKILVIGSSFGRDFVNILVESGLSKDVSLSYFDEERVLNDSNLILRINQADKVFFVSRDIIDPNYIRNIEMKYNKTVDLSKFWFVGTKDFGFSNGITYNKKRLNPQLEISSITVKMKKGVLDTHQQMKSLWKDRYVDILQFVLTDNNQVRVFTPEGKFISQDTVHLTKAGAVFFASKLKQRLSEILIFSD